MSIRQLPAALSGTRSAGQGFMPPPSVFDRFNPGIRAADEKTDNTISLFGIIGEDFFSTGAGNTIKRVSSALRSIGDKPVTVVMNSPGGDFFEGLAIYNILREHRNKITVKVLGLAASAASIIAMAGDDVQVARAGFLMIHNTQVISIGDRHDMLATHDMLEPFDAQLADIYAVHTGQEMKAITKMLDREAWMGGQEAVDRGFADSLLPSDQVLEDAAVAAELSAGVAAHRLDAVLAKGGMPRGERRKLIREIKTGMPSAAQNGTPSAAAVTGLSEALGRLKATLS